MEKNFDINDGKNNIKCKVYCNDPHNINSVIISCHGFGGSRDNSSTKKIADTFLEKYDDVALITFDWPCHGEDVKQKLRLSDCNDYLESVINYVKNILHVDVLFLQATSFGGYLSLKYINEHTNPFKKIALRCPAVNMYDVLTKNILTVEDIDIINKGKIALTGFERKIKIDKEFVEELKNNNIAQKNFIDESADMLIMHGTKDELVSYEFVKRFAENNNIDFETIEAADHRFTNPAKMRQCIDFMEILYEDYFDKSRSK